MSKALAAAAAILPFPDKRRPAKAHLRRDVYDSVRRSLVKLPLLGAENPDAALVIERQIDDWRQAAPPRAREPVAVSYGTYDGTSLALALGQRPLYKW